MIFVPNKIFSLAGVVGLEPTEKNAAVKALCLTILATPHYMVG